MKNNIERRFWAKVKIGNSTECWPWIGAKSSGGYGSIDSISAHRVSYEIHNGEIPAGLYVLHECDNPECVNPAHLHLGTHIENMREMKDRKRGRTSKKIGHDNPAAKLTEKDIIEIRYRYIVLNVASRELSDIFGVNMGSIHNIVSGKTWKNIPLDYIYKPNEKSNSKRSVGIERHNAIFDEKTVLEIRREYKNKNITQLQLSKKYNVSPDAINCIVNRKTWKHI